MSHHTGGNAPSSISVLRIAIWRVIDCQHLDGCAGDIGQTNQPGAGPSEMFSPHIASRMKQAGHLHGLWINARNIGALVAVAKTACERQVAFVRRAAMLLGNHMIERKSEA